MAEVLVSQFFTKFGVPVELHSDQERNFEAQTFQEVYLLLGIHKPRTTPYRSESDGMVERFNQTVEMAIFVAITKPTWISTFPCY